MQITPTRRWPSPVRCRARPSMRFAVVDADPVDALDARRLVADHRRHGPLQHGEEVRVVLADGVDDEAVDARTVHCGDVRVLGAHRHQQQPLARRLARQREPLEEAGGHGVAEGVRQRLGEQQPDGPGPAGAQRTRHGVRDRGSRAAGRPPARAPAAAPRAGPAGCRRSRQSSGKHPARRPATRAWRVCAPWRTRTWTHGSRCTRCPEPWAPSTGKHHRLE